MTFKLTLSHDATFADLQQVSPAQWYAMPTIESGHFDNLKYQGDTFRVWLSRMSRRDYDEGPEGTTAYTAERMTVEQLIGGRWVKLDRYGRPVAE